MDNSKHQVITDFLNYIKNVRRYSSHTIRSYCHDLEEYYSFCKDFNPEQEFFHLDHTAIQSYLQHLTRKGLSARTLARRLASIKSLYKYMQINNIVELNIARLVKTPKINRKLPHYLSLKEAHNILQLPTGNNEKALRDHLILELFYATGIRISELINIRMHDIRIEEGIIHILGKGSKERIVIMGDEATESLRSYLIVKNKINPRSDKNDYLFPGIRKNKSGKIKAISQRKVFNIVKKYLKVISNDEKLSPHSLRHTFATHMLDNGADLMAIKDMLGHNSLSSTQVYTHLQPEKIKKIYKQSHPHAK